MKASKSLNNARKAMGLASLRAAADEKAARIARHTARTAKAKLKQARKLAKLTKKAAKKAKGQAAESWVAFEKARADLKDVEKKQKSPKKKTPPKKASQPAKAKKARRPAPPKRAKRVVRHRPKPVAALPAPSSTERLEQIAPNPVPEPVDDGTSENMPG